MTNLEAIQYVTALAAHFKNASPKCHLEALVKILHDLIDVEYSDKGKLTAAEITAGTSIGKIEAVKQHKYRTGLSLIDSKQVVEDYFKQNGLQFHTYNP